MPKLRVAMIAPPWLALPIEGYGGIELVLEGLIPELIKKGVEVEVFANGAHKLSGVKTHSLYTEEQYKYIHHPLFDSLPILLAHMQFALNRIKADGRFDIIHDHTGFLGAHQLALATKLHDIPPALHTLHGPPFTDDKTREYDQPDNRPMYEQLEDLGNLYLVGISNALTKTAPESIRPRILASVHNAIELSNFPVVKDKKNYFITLARFTPDKGQHVAVKSAVDLKQHLRMAGTVAGIGNNRKLLLELSNPQSDYRSSRDFSYYSDEILPLVLLNPRITYSGNLSGLRKIKFIAESKALLFPIQWEEPFGMSVIEALACGTPVVAMNRGAMPEIIEHGVTGFLANNEAEFTQYMKRVDEIDPDACRRSVEERFSASSMAKEYIDRYREVLRLTGKQKTD